MNNELKELEQKIKNIRADLELFENQGLSDEANAIRQTLEMLKEQYNVLKTENNNTK